MKTHLDTEHSRLHQIAHYIMNLPCKDEPIHLLCICVFP